MVRALTWNGPSRTRANLMRDRINAALKTAMKDKEQLRVSTLRLICAALKEREIAQRSEDDAGQLDNAVVMQVLAKMVKQHEEKIVAFGKQFLVLVMQLVSQRNGAWLAVG